MSLGANYRTGSDEQCWYGCQNNLVELCKRIAVRHANVVFSATPTMPEARQHILNRHIQANDLEYFLLSVKAVQASHAYIVDHMEYQRYVPYDQFDTNMLCSHSYVSPSYPTTHQQTAMTDNAAPPPWFAHQHQSIEASSVLL